MSVNLKKDKYNAVLGVIIDLSRAHKTITGLVIDLKKHFTILKSSSIYKRDGKTYLQNSRSELVFAIQVETNEDLNSVFFLLQKIHNKADSFDVLLLTFENEIQILPNLTVPDPRLVQDPTILRCAVEINSTYLHPILGQTLKELVSSKVQSLKTDLEQVEFYSQGTTLLGRFE